MYRLVVLSVAILALSFGCQTPPTPGDDSQLLSNEAIELKLPTGIDAPPPIPEDNPLTPAKIELGRQLFFDTRLSASGNISCATCHNPAMGFTDGRPNSIGVNAQTGARSAPSIINLAYATTGIFWDGRAPSLEAQAEGPMANPIEMGNTHEAVVTTVNGLTGYREQFKHVFGQETATIKEVAKAIAAFERTIISGNSPWDKYLKGDATAMSESATRGWALFQGKANCIPCHAGFNLTDNAFHNIGVGFDRPNVDLGRYEVTKLEEDKGRFKTPTLREIVYTAPYMHDGSEPTLESVIEYYDRGGVKNPQLDEKMKVLKLTPEEKADLLAFLKALSGEGWQAKMPLSFPSSASR